MKVGILSAVPTCGKTTLAELLAAVFTISQRRTAAIFSTGDLDDLKRSVELHNSDANPKTDIIRAMIEASPQDRMLLDYGIRIGMENVFLYDVLGVDMEEWDKADFLKKAVNSVPVDLTIVEFTGDLNNIVNQEVFKEMDCSFMLVPTTWKAISSYTKVLERMPVCPARYNNKLVAAVIDPKSIGDKKFAQLLGTKTEEVLRFPEGDLIPKEALAAHLDVVGSKIVLGDPNWQFLRTPMYEMMCYLFDTENYKVIRPMEKWYR